MRNIRRPVKYNELVNQLCVYQSKELGRSAFKTFRDLYVFAALLGFQLRKEEIVSVPSTELDSRPFAADDATMEAMLSLALADTKDRAMLMQANDDKVVDVFERFLAGGLGQIQSWCEANATDDSGVRAILQGMVDAKMIEGDRGKAGGEVTF